MPTPGYGSNGLRTKATGRVTWAGSPPPRESAERQEAPQVHALGTFAIPQVDLSDTEVLREKNEGGSF